MPISALLLCLMFVLAAASSALAQDDYVPPPMFDDVQPRPESTTGNIVEPRSSSKDSEKLPGAPLSPTAPAAPSAPKIVTSPDAPPFIQPIVEGTKKPSAPASKKPQADKPKEASAPLPLPPKKPNTPTPAAVAEKPVMPEEKPEASIENKPQPAAKVTSKGVVTGPKTMPSVPAQAVEQQVLDLTAPIADSPAPRGPDEAPEGETIMERHQHEMEAKQAEQEQKEDSVAALQAADIPPMEFESDGSQEVLKKILPFAPEQINLPPDDLAAIGAGIKEELRKRDTWRIQIRSYATSSGSGVSSDKRVSLSRAIALRKFLVDQGVRASRIDVRAEGNEPAPEGKSRDRIDLYLYSPTEKPIVF